MDRKTFVDILALVKPALATTEMIPVMKHYWFTGTHIMAFNDQIAISVVCETEFQGAVPDSIYDVVKTWTAAELEMSEPRPGELKIKAGRSVLTLPIIPPDAFVFEMPAKGKKPLLVNKDNFCARIQNCMRSLSTDTSIPDQLGVTLLVDGEYIDFFSTDSKSLSNGYLKLDDKPSFDRAILSKPFCEQLLVLKNRENVGLEVYDDRVLMTSDDVQLFGRLVYVEKPLDYQKVLKRGMPDDWKDQLFDMSKDKTFNREDFVSIIERACIITESKITPTSTTFQVKDGILHLSSQSDRGEIYDDIDMDGHPNVNVRCDPKLIKAGLPDFDEILITSKCLIMARKDMVYLIATRNA
jgi:DNA polymerase III sliding clamp (beta) subunit (PCNA family)